MLSRQLIIASLALLVAHAHPARADEDRAKAQQYFRLGEKAYQAQNFGAAAENFEEAYKYFQIPEIAFSAAQAYRRQYRIDPKPEYVALAVKHYQAYLAKVKSGGRVADAVDALAEMQQELARIIKSGQKVSDEIARDYTRIVINASLGKETDSAALQEVSDKAAKTDDVKVTAKLDGQPAEPFAPLAVSPGKHRIAVSAPGYYPMEREENVPQGDTAIADFQLRPKPARVTVNTEDGSRILVDGRSQPTHSFELQAGRHVVSVLHRGRLGVARELTVERGQEMTFDQPLQKTMRRKVVPWLLIGSGAAAALAGASTVLAVQKDHEARNILKLDIQTTGDQPASTRARYYDARTWRDRYVIGAFTWGGACVALAGVAALLYYTDDPSPDGVRVEPMAAPGGGGAAIAGSF
jgi:hypothetical protein